MIVYDPLDNWMRRIPPIPAEFDLNFTAATVCASVPNKLVLLGFRKDKILTGQVCIFDFGSAKWYRGKDMPPCSYAFRCRVKPDRGLIFAAGGYSKYNRFKPYTAVYRVEEDRWIKPVPEISKEHFDGWASIDGKNFELRVFEEKASIWIPGEARPWWPGLYECECPCVAAFGRFYLFDSEGVNVILGPQEKGKEKERCVVEQFQFPHKLLAVDFAQLCGDYIYVVAVESEHRLWVSYLFRPLSQNHTWSVSEPPQDRYFNICSVKI